MGQDHLHTKEFIVGAAVGSLLGGIAALLTAPSAGKKFREDLCHTYCNLSDKAEELADRGKSIAKHLGCHTCDWTNQAKSAFNGAIKDVKGCCLSNEEMEEGCHTSRDLLIGGLVGGAMGAALALLFAPKSGENLRQDIAEICGEMSEKSHEFADDMTKKGKAFAKSTNSTAHKWLSLAQHFVNDLSDDAQEKGEELIDHVKDLVNHPKVNEMLDWAHLGYRAWHGIQSKKRR